jgi:DNA-binding NtrC family response regulator
MEAELFGHERGAFTDAKAMKKGLFEVSDGGTLFLDEIGELSPLLQAKLLRVLEDQVIRRVGGIRDMQVDVRVIAASNRDLEAEVRAGRFRRDLYYRLLVVPIRVPSLRERRDDIPELAGLFLAAACRRHRVRAKRIGATALEALQAHSWPGNVRELRNAMERVSILAAGEEIAAADLAFLAPGTAGADGVPAPRGSFDLAAEMERHERALVLAVLERSGWRMTRAARELGLERSHLYKKLRALGIDRPTED